MNTKLLTLAGLISMTSFVHADLVSGPEAIIIPLVVILIIGVIIIGAITIGLALLFFVYKKLSKKETSVNKTEAQTSKRAKK